MAVAPNLLEPDNDRTPIATDWTGNDLYAGDDVILFEGEYVLVDEAMEFMLARGARIELEEPNE
jgi:hypothetical protein